MRPPVPFILLSILALSSAETAASDSKDLRPDLKHFRSESVGVVDAGLSTAINILPLPADRGPSDVRPKMHVTLGNKAARVLWVSVRFTPPAPDPSCGEFVMRLEPGRTGRYTCTQDTLFPNMDYPVDVLVFADSALADTIERIATRVRYSKGDLQEIQDRIVFRRREIEAGKLPRVYERVVLKENMGLAASLFGDMTFSNGGTLTVSAEGLEHVTKKRTFKISAAQLQRTGFDAVGEWLVVEYDEGGTPKKLGLQAAAKAAPGMIAMVAASIDALIEQRKRNP